MNKPNTEITLDMERQIKQWEADPEKAEEEAFARLEEWVRQEKIRRKVQ